LPFFGNTPGLSLANGEIDLTGVITNDAFSVPRDGTITAISGFFSNTASLLALGTIVTISVQVYQSLDGNIFTPLEGAMLNLSPTLSGAGPIALGTVSFGTITGLNIPVVENSRLLLVFQAVSNGGPDVVSITQGYASAGISID